MTYEELINFFGNPTKIHRAINVALPNIAYWKKINNIPIERQCYIEIITQGRLKADRSKLPSIDFNTGIITPLKHSLKKEDKQHVA